MNTATKQMFTVKNKLNGDTYSTFGTRRIIEGVSFTQVVTKGNKVALIRSDSLQKIHS